MKNLKRLIAFVFAAFLVWTCNTSDSKGPTTITLTLSDSVRANLKNGDSLLVLRFGIRGPGANDIVLQDTLYHGLYSTPDQLENLPLPPPTLLNYAVVLHVFRDGKKFLSRELVFADGKPGVFHEISVTVDTTGKNNIDTAKSDKVDSTAKGTGKATLTVSPKSLSLNAGGASGLLLASVAP